MLACNEEELASKVLRKMGSDMLPWNYSGLAAHEVCSSISCLISNATLPFMDFSVTFFLDMFCLSDPPGHQGFYMLIPGVLPDISALIPEIVAGNPELSSTSQVPIFFFMV